MENINENILSFKNFKEYGSLILLERGLRLGDTLWFMPCEGREFQVNLNRTRYDICSSRDHKGKVEGNKIILPNLGGKPFFYQISLCLKNPTDENENDSRYLLKSVSSIPFRQNNSFSFESFLERGDVIDIGYNRIRVQSIRNEEPDMLLFEDSDELLSNIPLLSSDLNILLEGETGTGKTILAKKIHEKSQRRGNFVHVNLSSFSEGLIESELFGHTKGAFTGAIFSKRGAFMQADHGTLFLDEIDSLPTHLQTKLLLTLDSKCVRPVGGEETFSPDIRLVLASGKKLINLVRDKKMREDFYYRISSGVKLELKPLRQKRENIQKACNWFMEKEDVIISLHLLNYYKEFSWPGNLRQLFSHLKRKKVLTKGRKLFYDKLDEELVFGFKIADKFSSSDDIVNLQEFKHRYIRHVYMRFDGSVDQVSSVLGISRNTLKTCMEKKVMPL